MGNTKDIVKALKSGAAKKGEDYSILLSLLQALLSNDSSSGNLLEQFENDPDGTSASLEQALGNAGAHQNAAIVSAANTINSGKPRNVVHATAHKKKRS